MRAVVLAVAVWACAGCPTSGAPGGGMSTGMQTEPDSTGSELASSSGTSAPVTTSDATTTGTTGAGSCGTGQTCLDAPPLGWMGPVVVANAAAVDELPACAAPYAAPDATRFEGFNAPEPAECSCECGVTPGLCDTLIQGWADDACFLLQDLVPVGASGCVPYERAEGSMTIFSDFSLCLPEEEEAIPEIAWDAAVTGCLGSAGEQECDASGSRCYDMPPAGFDAEVCYVAAGELECPENTVFQERTIRYDAVLDDRACTDCSCGNLPACLLTYDYYDTGDCSGEPIGTATTSQCEPVANVAAIEFDFEGVSCPTVPGEPVGSATPLDPWTYCCAAVDGQ